ncbi:MAG: leucyl aminopeptidase [Lentimicrobiaceae bacterium]|jgi:leucyl aminopeptidase|nr:leucyl aminopeptidase [Lentimicrobiaceae bacterium]
MTTPVIFSENTKQQVKVYLVDSKEVVEKLDLTADEKAFVYTQHNDSKCESIYINRYTETIYVLFFNSKKIRVQKSESCRKQGAVLCSHINMHKWETVFISSPDGFASEVLAVAEGMALANYSFDKYKSDKKNKNTLKEIAIEKGLVSEHALAELNNTIEAVIWARDLVNEPLNKLNATDFSEIISEKIREVGGKTEILNKKKIEALKMGGLLAVNQGSIDPPTFTILEWNPENKMNDKPIILVGKGVVFDTGGYNLKTGSYMNDMKSDMAGAATVSAAVFAAAKSKIPLHVIALVPSTDNRLNGNAHVSGDVITMFDGTTVEVLNTDAEGRLILADALAYAKKFKPEMVFSFATLTGAASRAIGTQGIVVIESKATDIFNELEKSGNYVHERLVKFPNWSEYGEMIKSDIADLKNIGGESAGMITAAKFLEHFTNYPFIHFDIAGPAYLDRADGYRPKGGTGVGIRLLMHYFSTLKRQKSKE